MNGKYHQSAGRVSLNVTPMLGLPREAYQHTATSVSTQTAAINYGRISIVVRGGDVRMERGDSPTASRTSSHFLEEGRHACDLIAGEKLAFVTDNDTSNDVQIDISAYD